MRIVDTDDPKLTRDLSPDELRHLYESRLVYRCIVCSTPTEPVLHPDGTRTLRQIDEALAEWAAGLAGSDVPIAVELTS